MNCPYFIFSVRIVVFSLLVTVFVTAAPAGYTGWYEAGLLPEGSGLIGAYDGRLYARKRDSANSAWEYYLAPLEANGAVGAWQSAGSANPRRDLFNKASFLNGYVYFHEMYNDNNSTLSRDCEYAQVNPDGTFGTFQSGTTTTTLRQNPAVTAYGNAFYALGGNYWNNGSFLSSTEYAALQPDGSLGPWQAGPNMTVQHPNPAVTAHDGYLYCFSGGRHGYLTNRVERAKIKPDGSLGSWVNMTEMALPQARYSFDVQVLDGMFYVFGGGTKTYGGNYLTSVLMGSFDEQGVFSGWQSAPDIPNTSGTHPVVLGDRLYLQSGDATIWTSKPLGQMPAVPEPATMLAGLAGLAGIGRYLRRRA